MNALKLKTVDYKCCERDRLNMKNYKILEKLLAGEKSKNANVVGMKKTQELEQ